MSFFKRLALFILIMAVLIFFFGLFPVVAQSTTTQKIGFGIDGFDLLQPQNCMENGHLTWRMS